MEALEPDIFDQVEQQFPSVMRSYVKDQTKQNLTKDQILEMVRREIDRNPPPPVIERVIEREIQKEDDTEYAEQSDIDSLKKTIEDLRKELKNKKGDTIIVGAPTALPNQQGQSGKVLSTTGDQLRWITAASGSGSGLSGYTVNNGSSLKTFDATDTTLNELARIVGTIITELSE